MPPETRFVTRFAAEPPQGALPTGRWAATLQAEFLAACLRIDTEGDGARRGRRDPLVPRPHVVGPHLRARDGAHVDRPGAVRLRLVPARRGGRRRPRSGALGVRVQRRLHERDRRGEPGLEARPLRRGDRRLARRAGSPRRHDARLGPPARARRDDRHRRARRPGRRPVRADRRPLHAARARRLPGRLPRHQAVQHPRRASWPPSRSTRRRTRSSRSIRVR